jgi:hypothetical protein
MRKFIESIIAQGQYRLADMEARIKKLFVTGDITEEDMAELLALAAEKVDDSKNLDLVAIIADLEQRVSALESKGIKVWVSGMVVAKGQTVLYDILKEGTMRYLRYDGGRATTSLSPGKINGWVVLDSADGAITHTVEKDEQGNIILVPVEQQTEE